MKPEHFAILLLLAAATSCGAIKELFSTPWEPDIKVYTRKEDGLLTDVISDLALGPDGAVWAAMEADWSLAGGISCFRNGEWRHFGQKSGFPYFTASHLAVDHNGVAWVGTSTDLPRSFYRFDGEDWVKIPGKETYHSMYFEHWMFVDSRGRLWIGSYGGVIAFAINPETLELNPVTALESLDGKMLEFHQMVEDASGNIWASTSIGVLKYETDNWELVTTVGISVTSGFGSITISPDGKIWAAARKSIYYLDEVGWHEFDYGTYLIGWPGLFALSDGSLLVIPVVGYDLQQVPSAMHGLFRYRNGARRAYDHNSFHDWPRAAVTCLLEDVAGNLWVGTHGKGLIRVSREFLDKN